MPYISQQARSKVDPALDELISLLRTSNFPVEEQDGVVNYSITRILKCVYPPRYFHYNRALGVLTAVALEFYRRVVAPYEDAKLSQNGDV